MRIIIYAIVIVVASVLIAYALQPTVSIVDNQMLQDKFDMKLESKVVLQIGQPIEGFLPSMFMEVFSGLMPEDFEGVQTYEGVYHVENSQIVFEKTAQQPITSAEDAISSMGMQTLLKNLSVRLDIEITDEESISQIVDAIE